MGLLTTIAQKAASSLQKWGPRHDSAQPKASFQPLDSAPSKLLRTDSFIKAKRLADFFPPGPESKASYFSTAYEAKRPAAWNALMTPKHQVTDSDRQKMREMAASVPLPIRAQKAHEKFKDILASAAETKADPKDIYINQDKGYAGVDGRLKILQRIKTLEKGLFTPTDDEALSYASIVTESTRCHLQAALDFIGSSYDLQNRLKTIMGFANSSVFLSDQRRNIAVAILVAFTDEIWESSKRHQQLGNSFVTSELVQFHSYLAKAAAMIEFPSDPES